jgi:hypothetical protein
MASISVARTPFGLGAGPGDRVTGDPETWLLDQLQRYDPQPAGIAATKGTPVMATALAEYLDDSRVLRMQMAAPPPLVTPEPAGGPRWIETGGWDMHTAQRGRLAAQPKGLDAMIGAARGLGRAGRRRWCWWPPSSGGRWGDEKCVSAYHRY